MGIFSAATEAMLSCRSSGVWAGVFGGTIEPGHSHCLQEHDGEDSWTGGIFLKQLHHICSSLEKRSNCQCAQDPALLLAGTAFGWSRTFTSGEFTQFCHSVAVSARDTLVSSSPSVATPHLGGCHEEKLKSAGTSGWILVKKENFTGWLFACLLLSPLGIIATEQQINKVLLWFLSIWDLEPWRRRPLAEELLYSILASLYSKHFT